MRAYVETCERGPSTSGTTAQGLQGGITKDSGVRRAASKSGVRGAMLTASGVSGISSQPATGVHGESKPKSSVLSDGGVHWESALKASMADDILSAHNEMPEH